MTMLKIIAINTISENGIRTENIIVFDIYVIIIYVCLNLTMKFSKNNSSI